MNLDVGSGHIEGVMFGSVMAIQLHDDGLQWHALCDCNEAFLVAADALIHGRVTTCGNCSGRGPAWPKSPTTELSSTWVRRALCGQYPAEMFYPLRGGRATAADAKRVCLSCPVRTQCLEWALDMGDAHGIWGGLTAEERKTLLRKRDGRPGAGQGWCGECGSIEHEFIDCSGASEAECA